MTGNIAKICEWISKNDDIAVFTHIRPDGDAYGTALALVLALRALGKRAFPACDDAVEEMYRFLPGSGGFVNGDNFPFEPKAVLCADIADRKRMGKLEVWFDKAQRTAVIDHHGTNPGFAHVNAIDASAAAAGEIALDVIRMLGVEITSEIAENLYVAISTDTGNFSFSSTSPETYKKAAECVACGVNVENTTRKLYRTRSLAKTKLLGSALDNIEMYAGGSVAAIRLTRDMYEKAGAVQADSQSIVNYLNEIENVKIGILADEIPGGVKFSFRAAGGANVASLAGVFGGGGHVAAAGASVFGVKMDEIFEKVIREAEKQVTETV